MNHLTRKVIDKNTTAQNTTIKQKLSAEGVVKKP